MATPIFFPQFKLAQFNGAAIDLDTADIRVAILTNAYVYNAAHDFFDDVTANQVAGTNYVAGGTQIAGVTLALDGDNPEWVHNDITWLQSAGAGFANGRIFMWYQNTGVAATSRLIMRMTEAADFGNVAGDLILDGSALTGVASFV